MNNPRCIFTLGFLLVFLLMNNYSTFLGAKQGLFTRRIVPLSFRPNTIFQPLRTNFLPEYSSAIFLASSMFFAMQRKFVFSSSEKVASTDSFLKIKVVLLKFFYRFIKNIAYFFGSVLNYISNKGKCFNHFLRKI